MAGHDTLFILEQHKIFKAFEDSLVENSLKTQNIIDCRDDILYLWHSSEACLLTLNIKTLEIDENVNYQRLVGTESITFTVSTVLVNPISTWVAISGPHGLCAMRLPRRSGSQALFQGGRDTIFCRSRILDERHFMSECEIYRIKWHPNSCTDSHVLVLSSDNSLKLYDVCDEDQPLKQVWRIGPRSGRMPLLAALGDSTVDVDIGLDNRAVLLCGNGNVRILDLSATEKSRLTIDGPLRMYPSADDNYGLESCSVLMLNEHFICVATCGGTLYHCILLPNGEFENSSKKTFQEPSKWGDRSSNRNLCNNYSHIETSQHPVDLTHSLYVIEAIELDLGLTLDDNDPSHTCPIHLKADEGTKNRYFCYHETGVHIITVPIIDQLQKFFSSSDENLADILPSLNSTSTIEYIICTKTSKMENINPPAGICVTYSTHALISILADGRLVVKPLDVSGPGEMLFNDSLDAIKADSSLNRSNLTMSLNEMHKVPFNNQIHQLLKHELSQPLLKMSSNTEPDAQECFELLSHATHVFREEYFSKIERARKELERRGKTLRLLKNLQLQEIEEWQCNRATISSETERLNEKCKTAQHIQKDLNERCKKVLRALRKKQSTPSHAEKEMTDQLEEYNKKMPKLMSEFSKIKQKIDIQKTQMHNWDASRKKEEIFLGKHLTEIIKNTLGQQTGQIKNLIEKVNFMKQEVGLD
ncbi:nuclear pore complex protein Nup88 [Arctopsyche grandis]|uniref:nuclear pore complex protein Nup88 n=1 Tax=Arctopsyche grandis TaxID=121162 RepID=UPI00406D7785